MKNEMDKTVAEILALPDNEIASWYMSTVNCPDDMEAVDLKALATAYTQLKADLATAKQGLEHYANCDNWGDESGHNDIFSVRPDENGFDLAQQTLDKISKE